MHLRVAIERLRDRFGVNVTSHPPAIGYQETIRKPIASAAATRSSPAATVSSATWCSTSSRCRAATASSSPRRWSAARCRATTSARWKRAFVDGLHAGPLGFPVVDLSVTLTDGSYHSVDSSDLAFRTAARVGLQRRPAAMPAGAAGADPRGRDRLPDRRHRQINAILSARRGQILGFDTRDGWSGWDCVRAMMPEAEIGDLIVELRSATAGAGSFTRQFDHMAEVTGRAADQIIAAHQHAA